MAVGRRERAVFDHTLLLRRVVRVCAEVIERFERVLVRRGFIPRTGVVVGPWGHTGLADLSDEDWEVLDRLRYQPAPVTPTEPPPEARHEERQPLADGGVVTYIKVPVPDDGHDWRRFPASVADRLDLVLHRVLEPLLAGRDSGGVERLWEELSDDELRTFVDLGLQRELILLDRAPDVQRAQWIASLTPEVLAEQLGPWECTEGVWEIAKQFPWRARVHRHRADGESDTPTPQTTRAP